MWLLYNASFKDNATLEQSLVADEVYFNEEIAIEVCGL
jgi:hypothetical protein